MNIHNILTEKLSWLFLEWRRFLQKRIIHFDITLQQMSLLKQLRKREFMSPHEIAEWLHCDRPTASVIIKNLIKKELVFKEKELSNAKFHRIIISDRGRAYLDTVDQSLAPLAVSPFDVLSREEAEELLRLLKKCCVRMTQIKFLSEEEKDDE